MKKGWKVIQSCQYIIFLKDFVVSCHVLYIDINT